MIGSQARKKSTKDILRMVLPSLTVTVIVLSVFLFKGIFPFGPETIDYYDMGQTNAPLYYHIWDVLHGKSPLFFSWYINGGQNLSMGSAIQWNISPFNLFFLLIPRRIVMRSLSVYILLHLSAMAATMQYFLFRMTPKSEWIVRYIFSVAYGLCGFTLTHYTIPTYLDTAVFLPILILTLFLLLKEGRAFPYTIMLGFTLALSYYLGAMHLIYLLILGGAYIVIAADKERKRDIAAKLTLGTIGGMFISSAITVPAFCEMLRSSRFNSNLSQPLLDTVLSILRSIGADQYYVKYWQLYAMESAVIVIVFGIIRLRREKIKVIYSIIFFFAPCALIPFESINLIWHMGTYYHYPIRCGYLIPFSLLATASYYVGELWEEKEKKAEDNKYLINIFFAVSGIISAAFVLVFYYSHEVWEIKQLFKIWTKYAIMMAVVFALILAFRKIPKEAFVWIMLSELIVGAAIGFGKPHFADIFFSDPEQSGEYVETALELKEELPIKEDPLYRIKNPDTCLNANYGMIIRRATVGGWANTLTRDAQKGAERLGYSTHFMRILDSGGTLFTDTLLGITEMAAIQDYPDTLYKKVDECGAYSLYELEYTMPYINIISQGIGKDETKDLDIVELHNMFYRELLSGAGFKPTAMEELAAWEYEGSKEKQMTELALDITGHKALYLRGGEAKEISVNGKAVPIPSINEPDNTAYPAWFNSNVIFLGDHNEETVIIGCPANSKLFSIDIDKLAMLSEVLKKNGKAEEAENSLKIKGMGLEFEIDAEDAGAMALIPINCDGISSVTVNSRPVSSIRVCGLLTGIVLEEGHDHIRINVIPPGLTIGVLVSLIMIILLFILWKIKLKIPIGVTGNIAMILVSVFWTLAVLCIYIVPIGYFMIYEVQKRI